MIATRRRSSGQQQPSITRNTPLCELPEFLTVEEFGAYLNVGRALAYTLAQTHGIRAGRLLRIPREAIEEFIRMRAAR